jgi:predicted transcriptional regulator
MPRKAELTPAEWEIMEAVWALGGSPSVRQVLEQAYPGGEKAYTTVQTVMNTLVRKGLLRRRKVGLVGFYRPTRSRAELGSAETRSLLRRAFGGSAAALADSLINLEDLDLEEIRAIKALLAERERALEEGKG